MDIRIGNDIRMQITLLGDGEYTQSNIVKLDAKLVNVSLKPGHCHHFPKFYDPTPYTTHNSGVPTYHVHPHYRIDEYCQFHPEFTEPHWWPNYCGFGVCSKKFCCHDSDILEQHLFCKIIDTNKIEAVFESRHQKFPGEYALIVKYTVYEPGYGPDNLHTYVADYGVVFNLTIKGGQLPPDPLYLPYEYVISVTTNNDDWGYVTKDPNKSTYSKDEELTIEAIPYEGYEFVCWHDEITDNPRQITVRNNAIYKAIFAEYSPTQKYTITVQANDPTMGSVSGGGQFEYGQNISISATANVGYRFVKWNDNDTSNPRTIEVTGNATYTAMFEQIPLEQYTITTVATPSGSGIVNGGGTYPVGQSVLLSAIPNSDYEFDYWDNDPEDINNPKTIIVNQNKTYTAHFKIAHRTYTITAEVNPEGSGIVNGTGTFEYGDTTALSAISNSGYKFSHWDNDLTDKSPSKFIQITENEHHIAHFDTVDPEHVVITTGVYPYDYVGSVTGGGEYNQGDIAILTALANPGWEFSRWSDDNTDNPRNIEVQDDSNYIAIFNAVQPSINIQLYYPQYGKIILTPTDPEGSSIEITNNYTGSFQYGQKLRLEAVPYEGYSFSSWNGGLRDNPRNITLTNNNSITALFSQNTYTVTASVPSDQSSRGYVTINPEQDSYQYGEEVTVTATPNSGYSFLYWTDENGHVVEYDSTYRFTVGGNVTLYANFSYITYQVTLTANPVNGGNPRATVDGPYPIGSSVTINANPTQGYQFVKWVDSNSGTIISTNEIYTVISISENLNYTAVYEQSEQEQILYGSIANFGQRTGAQRVVNIQDIQTLSSKNVSEFTQDINNLAETQQELFEGYFILVPSDITTLKPQMYNPVQGWIDFEEISSGGYQIQWDGSTTITYNNVTYKIYGVSAIDSGTTRKYGINKIN